MTVEQMYFTWNQAGRYGRGMYQTFAKSVGFDLLPSGTRDLARKLCCYNKPASMSERPESFGWIDSAGSRIAFCRSLLPIPHTGSPETFAAHIVAGPVAELKAVDILESFNLGMWWRGAVFEARQHGPRLPPFDFDSSWHRSAIPSTGIGDPGVRLVEQLLRGRDKVSFQATPDEAVEALRRVARAMPSVLDGLTFSSFEYGDSEDWFSIVGNAWPPPVQGNDPEAYAAAGYLLSRRGRAKWVGGIEAAEDSRAHALERVTTLAAVLARINDGAQVSTEDLVLVLSAHDVIGDLFHSSRVRELVAARLLENDAHVADLVQKNAPHIDRDFLAQLPVRVIAVPASGPSAPEAAASAVPEPLSEITSAVNRMESAGNDEQIQGGTMAVSTSRSNVVRRGPRRVPGRLRAPGPDAVMDGGEPTVEDTAGLPGSLPGDARQVGELFENDPQALMAACRSMTQPARERVACLVINHLRFVTVSMDAGHAPALEDLLTELPLREQVQAWKLILDGEHRIPAEIGEAIDRCVTGYFSRMVEDHRLPFCDELTGIVKAVPACWRWAALLGAAPTGQLGSIEDALEAFSAAEYGIASLVAFDVLAIKGPRTPEGLSVIYRLGSVGGVTPPVRARRYLRTGFRQAFHRQRPTALVWAFDQVLKNGDFVEPLSGRVGHLLWALLSNERGSSDTDVLLQEAGSALDWLTTAAPEQSRVLMNNAPGIYAKASVRWLDQVAKAVTAQPARDLEGSLLIPGGQAKHPGIQPYRPIRAGHGTRAHHGHAVGGRQLHRKVRVSRRG